MASQVAARDSPVFFKIAPGWTQTGAEVAKGDPKISMLNWAQVTTQSMPDNSTLRGGLLNQSPDSWVRVNGAATCLFGCVSPLSPQSSFLLYCRMEVYNALCVHRVCVCYAM